ncbi:MAG: outer membrane protein assembly factor BamD [Planctomycetota bacterium]
MLQSIRRMTSRARNLALFLPIWLIALTACVSPVPNEPPDRLIERGKDALEEGKYKRAGEVFIAIKQRHPESLEDEEASFLLAESKRLERYGGASFKAYQDFATRYPNSRYAVAAAEGEYKLGNAYFDKTLRGVLFFKPDPLVGARVLGHMQITFRNHSLADDALMDIGDYFVKDRSWQKAATAFQKLLQEYPRSSHVLRARFQYARTLFEMNQGPDYDERLLLDARRSFRDFVNAVRADGMEVELEEKIQSAGEYQVKIMERLGRKQYRIGRFYERTRNPGAALFYYNFLLTTYPDSKAAKDAARRAKILVDRGVVERPGAPENPPADPAS